MLSAIKALCKHSEFLNYLLLVYVIVGLFFVIIIGIHSAGFLDSFFLNLAGFMYCGFALVFLQHFIKATKS